MLSAHTIHQACHHTVWDNSLEPALTVAPGDRVHLKVADASNGQITPASRADVFAGFDSRNVNPVTGPIAVDGAEPGDALVVHLDHYAPSGWGWTANIPGFGLLADDFPDPALHHWRYDTSGGRPILFGDVAQVPLAPFTGTIGVAPAESGRHSIIPPRRVGGNLDMRDLIAGSRLVLPVEVPGALLSIGDTHAAQGDGEVCGTAIESPMEVDVRVELIKGGAPRMPRVHSPARPVLPGDNGHRTITTGVGPDVIEAARMAVREMIDGLASQHGLNPTDAYMLISVAGDLRISQLVDAPNWTVSCHMPDAMFGV